MGYSGRRRLSAAYASGEISASLLSDKAVRNSAAGGHAGLLCCSGDVRLHTDFRRLHRTQQVGIRAAQGSEFVQAPAPRTASVAAGSRANRSGTISAQAARASANGPHPACAGQGAPAAAPRHCDGAAEAGSQHQPGNQSRAVKAAGLPERLAGGWPHSRRLRIGSGKV